jgi:dienelactone hydrolase
MRCFSLSLLLLLSSTALADGDPPYPKGSTSQNFADLKFQLVVPQDFDSAKEYSLVVVLHGAGGTETGMAGTLRELANFDFIVCAPKSKGPTWSTPDLKNVKKIILHLKQVFPIGAKRSHCMGFSNGGWNLDPIAFDEDLHMVSACWVAAGCRGGKVPRSAKKEMGALALAGSQDGNRGAAEKTVDILKDKVRSVECRLQPGLGHAFPSELLPYYLYWVKVMDGRFVVGEDMSFTWTGDVEAAKRRMADKKLGGFVYFWSKDDQENELAKRLQNEIFFDFLVRHFGSQLVAIKLERSANEELFSGFKLKETPAVVVLKKDFKLSKAFAGKKIKASSLAGALRKYAKDKSIPK